MHNNRTSYCKHSPPAVLSNHSQPSFTSPWKAIWQIRSTENVFRWTSRILFSFIPNSNLSSTQGGVVHEIAANCLGEHRRRLEIEASTCLCFSACNLSEENKQWNWKGGEFCSCDPSPAAINW
eukprot:TRINITY_DN5498_c0_g2_i1.p2 TRINITY_DN5498_c0_g2~~TRINITY_DN5498_c0_g2_i1.p2  ORF type:complete len:123 (+),score=29.11 TRINITY_DN5498_c0_g2_i1:456-824(+)